MHPANPEFSVIIPALNEQAIVKSAVRAVLRLDPQVEIVVADGGSRDGSAALARQAGARVVESAPGRGTQCNAGAAAATGDILLFLHTDTRLPLDAFPTLRRVFSDPRVHIGAFRLMFDWRHPVLRLYEPFSRVDSIFTRFGDQCITVRRAFFDRLGGFPNWPLFEDVRLLQKARRITRIHSFPAAVVSSARRYRSNGVVRQQLLNLWLMALYLSGASPETLARRYRSRRRFRKDARGRLSKRSPKIS